MVDSNLKVSVTLLHETNEEEEECRKQTPFRQKPVKKGRVGII